MLGVLIARTVPRRFGYWLARRIARWMRRNRYDMFRTLRENLSHVVPEADDAALDDLAERAVYQAGCCYFDMIHFRPNDLRKRDILVYDAAQWEAVRRLMDDERGMIIVGPHLSNFDLAAQWFVVQGYALHALSLANPDRGDRVVNAMRRQRGIVVTPINVNALRKAMRRLREGGIVITGVDRPASYDGERTPFFGVPAPVPRGHVRLALQTGARLVVAYCIRQPDGRYELHLSPPIEVERTGDRDADTERTVRLVLTLVEEAIRGAPEQWVMLVPVWREPGAAR
jgi:lauroyl/myristoyl acyltransferase